MKAQCRNAQGTLKWLLMLLVLLSIFLLEAPGNANEDLKSKLFGIASDILEAICRTSIDENAQLRIDYDSLTPEAREIVLNAVLNEISKGHIYQEEHREMSTKATVLDFSSNADTAVLKMYFAVHETITSFETSQQSIDPETTIPRVSAYGLSLIVAFHEENGTWKISRISSRVPTGMFPWDDVGSSETCCHGE